VHKAIRRIAPAPRTRYTKGNTVVDAPATDDDTDADERTHLLGPKDSSSQSRKSSLSGSREATLLLRRRSSTSSDKNRPLPMRSNTADLRQHLKHLGPSNVASRPKATKYSSVKIKPGVGTIPENRVPTAASTHEAESSQVATSQTVVNGDSSRPEGGIGAGLIGSAALEAQDGAHAVAHGYGSISPGSKNPSIHEEAEVQAEHEATSSKPMTASEASAFADSHTAANLEASERNAHDQEQRSNQQNGTHEPFEQEQPDLPQKLVVQGGTSRPVSQDRRGSGSSHSTLGEMEDDRPGIRSRRAVRSGSITENIVDMNGMKKVVLEANSSSDGDEQKGTNDGANDKNGHDDDQDDAGNDNAGHDDSKDTKRKKKKKRGGKKFRNKGDSVKSRSGDSTPLLSQGDR
jgi:metal transporter CNNM